MNGAFGWAPAFLVAYFAVAMLAPAICKGLGRGGMLALALLPGATTVWAAAQIPAVLNGGSRTANIAMGAVRCRCRSTCGWTRWRW